uniref:Uncharacterized protein n=1 Tax=Bracon brevicornis TaxID=1563983 RepID=A0A6V7JI83_9HYME
MKRSVQGDGVATRDHQWHHVIARRSGAGVGYKNINQVRGHSGIKHLVGQAAQEVLPALLTLHPAQPNRIRCDVLIQP